MTAGGSFGGKAKEVTMARNRLLRALALTGVSAMAALLVPGSVFAADAVKIQTGAGQKMEATLYMPAGAGPFPAVLVLHTSSGLRPPDHGYARRLADEGYVCLVPDFFTPYGLSNFNRRQTFTTHGEAIYADFVAARDMLKKMKEVQADRIGAVGFSNGGYWALLLAARGDIRAGVSYYGAVTAAGTDNSLSAFRTAFTASSSPVLVLHGARDDTVLPRHAEYLKSVLVEAKAPFEFQMYDSAGHSFERGKNGDQSAADDAWRRTLRFFDTILRNR
jgi:carboxymethylenebutenolidase